MFRQITFEAEVIITVFDKERVKEFTRGEVALAALTLEQRINAALPMEDEYGKASMRLHIGKEKENGDNKDQDMA